MQWPEYYSLTSHFTIPTTKLGIAHVLNSDQLYFTDKKKSPQKNEIKMGTDFQ
jgi:hypothetical protein